jgi:hypothetical protein
MNCGFCKAPGQLNSIRAVFSSMPVAEILLGLSSRLLVQAN